jgi:hypothetical protein
MDQLLVFRGVAKISGVLLLRKVEDNALSL